MKEEEGSSQPVRAVVDLALNGGNPQTRTVEYSTGVEPTEIVSDLGPVLASLATAGESSRPAHRVVIHDREAPPTLQGGDIILGIGLGLGDSLLSYIGRAGEHQASALVLRLDASPAKAVIAACQAQRLALIIVDPHVPWERIYLLIQASIGSRVMQSIDERKSSVPLGNMFELAAALDDLVGGPVILEDSYFRVIGYSAYSGESDSGRQAAILMRHIPPQWMEFLHQTGTLWKLRNTDEVTRLDGGPGDARPRLITSVRLDGELLGIIWVSEGDAPLNDESIEGLAQGRLLAVPHFRRYLTMDRLGNYRRSELLRRLIEGTGNAGQIVRELGLNEHVRYTLVALFHHDRSRIHPTAVRDSEVFSAHLEFFSPNAMTTVVRDVTYGLVPISAAGDLFRLQEMAAKFTSGRLGRATQAVVALSCPRPVAGSLEDSRDELETLFILSSSDTPRNVIAGWDFEAAVMVKRGESILGRDGHFVFSKLAALEEHDAIHGTHFVDTVSCVLRLGWNISRAAEALRLHHTTLRYRMARINEISQFNIDDPAERLAATLHLLAVGKAQ